MRDRLRQVCELGVLETPLVLLLAPAQCCKAVPATRAAVKASFPLAAVCRDSCCAAGRGDGQAAGRVNQIQSLDSSEERRWRIHVEGKLVGLGEMRGPMDEREGDTDRPTSKWKKADDDDDICLPFILLTCGGPHGTATIEPYLPHLILLFESVTHTQTPTLNPARVA